MFGGRSPYARYEVEGVTIRNGGGSFAALYVISPNGAFNTSYPGPSGSITIKDNIVTDNSGAEQGGGILAYSTGGAVTVSRNIIARNTIMGGDVLGFVGGAWIGSRTGNILVANNVVAGNTGGGLYVETFGGRVDIINNTVTGNPWVGLTLQLQSVAAQVHLYNNIIWSQDYDIIEIRNLQGGTIDAYNNDFDPLKVDTGEEFPSGSPFAHEGGNINVNPLFENAVGKKGTVLTKWNYFRRENTELYPHMPFFTETDKHFNCFFLGG